MERRRFIRLNSVFPVAIQFFLPHNHIQRIYQGFTRNVSFEGLCIETSDLNEEAQAILSDPQLQLQLVINMPLASQPTQAKAKVAWTKTVEAVFPRQYLIGVNYEDIDQQARKNIFAYAKRVRNTPRYITAAMLFLLISASFFLVHDFMVRRQNYLLVEKTVQLATQYSELRQKLWMADRREEIIKDELKQNAVEQERLQTEMGKMRQAMREQRNASNALLSQRQEFEKTLQDMENRAMRLKDQLNQLGWEKNALTSDFASLEQENQGLKRATLQSLYHWLKTHQVSTSGLVVSFEGDRDLEDWAFTYDQSLSAQVFTLFGDYERARKIFDFYKHKAEKVKGGFVNAYEVERGSVAEYIVHSGPNIWLGIAAMQYTKLSRDTEYIDLARSIADWAIEIQNLDTDYGIRGGPGLVWFSTEHNLDAYALFNMLYLVTGDIKYQQARQRTLDWLKKYAYNSFHPPMKRGRGDATIATDTFSWAICSLGPGVLEQTDMDPEQIIAYAEENCAVRVWYSRPDGHSVEVCGFDFSRFSNSPRGGAISTEWTAQMIVAYQVLADHFSSFLNHEKADLFAQKAKFYLNELNKMVICSPSKTGQGQGCLPYASLANIDTGHGWRTPKGDRTGSLAGTAYAIFAHLGYNPLSLPQKAGERLARHK
ncbi:MAG: PilZ domain-containing protein [Candidatus Omnitrophica bacterium]|nr:PilZ domain-containing protein [Candidatus Omnitrophota bacterium]